MLFLDFSQIVHQLIEIFDCQRFGLRNDQNVIACDESGNGGVVEGWWVVKYCKVHRIAGKVLGDWQQCTLSLGPVRYFV